MRAVIIGCGRVGAGLADELDRAGWQVLIIDMSQAAFDRLPSSFRGTALRGDGTDEDTLRRAGAEGADLFLALTEGDNRNIMAAQLGVEVLGARRTVAKVNDPVRADAYADLGIATLCRTNLMTAAVLGYAGQAVPQRPGIYAPRNPHRHAPEEGVAGTGGTAAAVSGGGSATAGAAPASSQQLDDPSSPQPAAEA